MLDACYIVSGNGVLSREKHFGRPMHGCGFMVGIFAVEIEECPQIPDVPFLSAVGMAPGVRAVGSDQTWVQQPPT